MYLMLFQTIKIYGATEKETLDVWNTVKFNTEDFSFSNNEKYMLSFVGHTTGKTSKIETGTSERKEVSQFKFVYYNKT